MGRPARGFRHPQSKQMTGVCASGKWDPDLWFPVSYRNNDEAAFAAALCYDCPIKDACLADALENRIDYGIFGGTTPEERRAMNRRSHVPHATPVSSGTVAMETAAS